MSDCPTKKIIRFEKRGLRLHGGNNDFLTLQVYMSCAKTSGYYMDWENSRVYCIRLQFQQLIRWMNKMQ